jgi:hypothetical protein
MNWYESQSTYICRVQSSVWRLPKYWPPTPLSTKRVCPPPAPEAGGTHSPGGKGVGGGSIFRKTPCIGLASFSINPLRYELSYLADTFPPPPPASPEGGGVQLRRRKGPPLPPAEPPSPASSLCSSRYSLISLSRPPSFLFKFQQSILVGIEKCSTCNVVLSTDFTVNPTGRRLPPPNSTSADYSLPS